MLRVWLYGSFLVLAVAAFSIRTPQPSSDYRAIAGEEMELVAHAGGGTPFGVYSNAREAFDACWARGFRLIETDFNWTHDGRLVLIHDWDDRCAHRFSPLPRALSLLRRLIAGPPSHADFLSTRMRGDQTPMDLPRLLDWMRHHPDARIVTDAKEDNLKVLRLIAETAGDRLQAFIPQAYAPEEVAQVRGLGFGQVILTRYRSMHLSDDDVVAFVRCTPLFALTLPAGRAATLLPRLAELGIPAAVHTINDPRDAAALRALGAVALYTDYLVPAGH